MSIQVSFPEWPLEQIRALADKLNVQVWPVGGTVRDAVLERTVHDWDFAVDNDGIALARAVGDTLGGAFFPLDEERDVGRVVVPHDDQTITLDFARLRRPDLGADLSARDFTINAMAAAPDGQVIDPQGGLGDLQSRLVRAIDPTVLEVDPLRMIRAVRLAAELDMSLEAKTANWIIQRAPLLTRSSPERIRDEFNRILAANKVADSVHMLDELTLLVHIIPEVEPLKDQAQSPPHRFDVWWHTLMVLDSVEGVVQTLTESPPQLNYMDGPGRVWDDISAEIGKYGPLIDSLLDKNEGARLLRLAALCHDLGKPLTCTEDDNGLLHFYGHEREGAAMASQRMEQLRYSRSEIDHVNTIVRAHLRPLHLAQTEGPITRRAIYRFFRATGDAGVSVALLSLADHASTWGPNLDPERWLRRVQVAGSLLHHYFERQHDTISPEPLITGRDLIDELDMEPGPKLGKLLDRVMEAQAADEIKTRKEALRLAKRLRRQNE
jgi:tRNA nucleotidyltransferase/poly(A) polymerase